MIKVMVGEKGVGKTKYILDDVNEAVKDLKGEIVFIDKSNSHITNVRHEVRYINISEFPISGLNDLFGFLCGLIAENYDITAIYMDGLDKFDETCGALPAFFDKVKGLADKYNTDFIFSASGKIDHLPDHVTTEYNH